MREFIVRPLGLVTRPNLYGQYPAGALRDAQNLVMRAPGILEAAPATVLGLSFGSANEVVHALLGLPDTQMVSIARTSGGTWTVRLNTTACHQTSNIAATFSQTGRAQVIECRDRVIVNTLDHGIKVMDPGSTELRDAGFAQPTMPLFTSNDPGSALEPGDCVGYATVYRREYDDGYILLSKPSPICIVRAGLSSTSPRFLLWFSPLTPYGYDGLAVGDYIDIYRTNVVPDSVASTDPGTTLQRIASIYVDASIKALGTYTFNDNTLPGPLGATSGQALYTNPTQKGLPGGHRVPDIAQCMAVFKNHVFYGNVTERPKVEIQVPAGISGTDVSGFDTDFWRTNGIGTRIVNGTVTNGSTTVTGISASHMLGLKVGQIVDSIAGPVYPNGTEITAVGVSSITTSAPPVGGGATIRCYDQIEIGGVSTKIADSPRQFLRFLANSASFSVFEIDCSEAMVGQQDPSLGIISPTVTLRRGRPSAFFLSGFSVRATNGANYNPKITEWTGTPPANPERTLKNLLRWSNDGQPEHVPAPNETQVGSGEIIALASTRDALWIFCTDGLYRLSGAGGLWRIDPVDTTLVLSSPRASCVLREVVYCYTNQGFGRVTDAGFEPLGDALVGDLLPGAEYTETADIILERNEVDDEIVIRVDALKVFVYSVRSNAFTTLNESAVTCMAYVRYPVSGAACLAFGRSPSGQTPRYELWNAPSSKLAAQAQFQPLYGKDPFSIKQWVDASFVFDAASVGALVTPYWNGVASPASALVGGSVFVKESRRNFGIPRSAPSVGNTLTVGYSIPSDASRPGKLFAISLRYRQFGEENLKRLANAG